MTGFYKTICGGKCRNIQVDMVLQLLIIGITKLTDEESSQGCYRKNKVIKSSNTTATKKFHFV